MSKRGGITTYPFTITTFRETTKSLVDRCSVTQFCVFSSVGSLLILSLDHHSNAPSVSANDQNNITETP